MNIESFSEKYCVKIRKDADGTLVVPGKLGHIYEHSAEKLGVLFMPSAPRARLWSLVKAQGTSAGMAVRQNGESEGTLLFDPANAEQARLALKLVRGRAKRVMSAAQSQALAEGRARSPLTLGEKALEASRNAVSAKHAPQGTKAA